jgi:hypothetical protein
VKVARVGERPVGARSTPPLGNLPPDRQPSIAAKPEPLGPGKANRLDNAPGTHRQAAEPSETNKPPRRPRQRGKPSQRNAQEALAQAAYSRPIVAYISNNKRPSLALTIVDVSRPNASRQEPAKTPRSRRFGFGGAEESKEPVAWSFVSSGSDSFDCECGSKKQVCKGILTLKKARAAIRLVKSTTARRIRKLNDPKGVVAHPPTKRSAGHPLAEHERNSYVDP